MVYLVITLGVFLLDLCLKSHFEHNYKRKEKHPKLHGRIILEKYYNQGAALNLLAKKPGVMKTLQTCLMLLVCIAYYFVLRMTGKRLEKTGLALLAGGGLSNLYDRYAKGHVVDYFRINLGPKWLRNIIFNISDFCIFIGAALAVLGSE